MGGVGQKQQINRPLASGGLIPLRCTEHKCFKRWAFCLNIATHKRQANGFSPTKRRRKRKKYDLIVALESTERRL